MCDTIRAQRDGISREFHAAQPIDGCNLRRAARRDLGARLGGHGRKRGPDSDPIGGSRTDVCDEDSTQRVVVERQCYRVLADPANHNYVLTVATSPRAYRVDERHHRPAPLSNM